MLNLIFQRNKAKNPKDVLIDSRGYFSRFKKEEWFSDKFVQEIIRKIDNAEIISGFVLKGYDGSIIPPEYLSIGSKTMICIYEFPDKIFNITQIGNNVVPFLVELCKQRDVTALTYREIPFRFFGDIGFLKDYQPVTYEDDIDYYDRFGEWLKEMFND